MNKILTSEQLREADRYTILHEPVASIALMERAAKACFHWLRSHEWSSETIRVFCGPGNNGGDGAALARMMGLQGKQVVCYFFGDKKTWSADLTANQARLGQIPGVDVIHAFGIEALPDSGNNELWIDALFGTGLSRPLEGWYRQVVETINKSGAKIIAIDIPSGLHGERIPAPDDTVVDAAITMTFHCPKLTFFFPESSRHVGQWHVLDIGLHPVFMASVESDLGYVDEHLIRQRFHRRDRFSHKGNHGHGLLLAGSNGKYGAAVLSARAALRSGIGLLSVMAPRNGEHILQTAVPEAMYLRNSGEDALTDQPVEKGRFDAIGFGPGCGTDPVTFQMLKNLISSAEAPLVIDADGLNLLSANKELFEDLPEGTVLTPHPKEFERMTRSAENELDRMSLQHDFAKSYGVVLVLKGACTRIATSEGMMWFNTTGNAGLARGGSGDILTGMILSFLAQGYDAGDAAVLGVYFHGLAADIVAKRTSMQSLSLEEVIDSFHEAFSRFEDPS